MLVPDKTSNYQLFHDQFQYLDEQNLIRYIGQSKYTFPIRAPMIVCNIPLLMNDQPISLCPSIWTGSSGNGACVFCWPIGENEVTLVSYVICTSWKSEWTKISLVSMSRQCESTKQNPQLLSVN